MDAYKVYPFVTIFVEKTGSDQMIFDWRKPGDTVDSGIPTDAFCTGWSNFHGGVLRLFFPFFLLPNVQVTFTIQTLPNPLYPRPANTIVSSAILIPQIALMNSVSSIVQSASSVTYPDNPLLTLVMSVGKIDKSKILNISITSPVPLPSSSTFIITLSGTGFLFEGRSVLFVSPSGTSATANLTDSPPVLTVQVQGSQQFPALTPIIFTFGNLTYAPTSNGMTGLSSSILSSSDARCIASSSSGVMGAVPRSRWVFMCGSAANNWSCD
jgi:hypothetical protein